MPLAADVAELSPQTLLLYNVVGLALEAPEWLRNVLPDGLQAPEA